MADSPGEGGFDVLRAGRDEARAVAGEAAPAAAREPRGSGRRWRAVALLLLVAGLVAAAVLLAPRLGERARPEEPVPAPVAPAAVAEPSPLAEAEALARRLAALEAELAAIRTAPPAGSGAADTAALAARLQALEAEARRIAEAEAATAGRLAALAADMDAAGVTSGAVAAATAEVRDIFLVVSLRRLVERGRPLGAFDPLLRQQFGTREPSAVAAVVAWSGAPVSRAMLAERLDSLAGSYSGAKADGSAQARGFWDRLWQRLSGLVEIRQGPETVAAPLIRARARLAEGDLPAAIAHAAAEPETAALAAWLEDARRLQAAEDALDRLELLVVQSATVPASG